MTTAQIALYNGPKGTMSREVGDFLLAHKVPLATVTDKDVAAGRLADFPAAIFPGGGGPVLTDKAIRNLKAYVAAGGGYVGICASAKFAGKIGLLDFESRDVRGVSTHYICVRIRHPISRGYTLFTDQRLPKPGIERVRIMRVNGAFLIPRSGATVVASYDDQGTLAAILTGRHGKGEVAVFSPHPELPVEPPARWEWQDGQAPAQLLLNAIGFVSKGKVKPSSAPRQ